MKALTRLASAATLAAVLSAQPVQAAVFAQFTPDAPAQDYRWVRAGALGDGGHLFSIVNPASPVAQGVANHFSFIDPALSALAFLPASFRLDATVTASPALNNGGGLFTQTQINGGFSFIYTGATTVIAGHSLVQNVTNLLSGVFTNAWIQGIGGSGSANLSVGNGGAAAFASDIEPFVGLVPNSEEFAFNLLNVSPGFNAPAAKALNPFRANGGGNFSFIGAPEPATWGLMILGLGGVGLMIRARRRPAVV